MQKARRHITKMLRPLVGERGQGLFPSSVRGSFHLSLTVLVHYRSSGSIQPWRMVPPDSHRISRVPRYSGYCYLYIIVLVRDYHPLWYNFPDVFQFNYISNVAVLQPHRCIATTMVWAFPRSLATTCGITFVFYSSRYLDVSVPWVCSLRQQCDTASLYRVAPFGNLGINGYLLLPQAYRSLSRPSSPPEAQASTVRPSLAS